MASPRVVVGALIVDSVDVPTRILAARRTGPERLAGKWEFPGGKVEIGESAEEALCRELREELGIDAKIGRELKSPSGDTWPISERYVMRLFYVSMGGQSVALDGSHDEVRWVSAIDVALLPWLPSDEAALPYVFREECGFG